MRASARIRIPRNRHRGIRASPVRKRRRTVGERAVSLALPGMALQDRAQRVGDRAQAERSRHGSVDAVFDMADHDAEVGGSIMAGALAYRFFVWLLPLALVAVAGLGIASSAASGTPESAARSAGLAGLVSSSVAGAAESSARWYALLIGVPILVVTTRSLLKTLVVTHRLIWADTRGSIPEAVDRRDTEAARCSRRILCTLGARRRGETLIVGGRRARDACRPASVCGVVALWSRPGFHIGMRRGGRLYRAPSCSASGSRASTRSSRTSSPRATANREPTARSGSLRRFSRGSS